MSDTSGNAETGGRPRRWRWLIWLGIIGLGVWWFYFKPASDDATGPSRLLRGDARIEGQADFSFMTGQVTDEGAGDVTFDDVELELKPGEGVSIVAMGPIEFEDLHEAPGYAPAQGWVDRPVDLTLGHVYCIRLPDGKRYAKLGVTEAKPRVGKGLFSSGDPGLLAFDFVTQTNGSRSFLTEPLDKSNPMVQLEQRRAELARQRSALQTKLDADIPRARASIEQQVATVQQDLQSAASDTVRSALTREKREIARALLALDDYEAQCRETVLLLRSSERSLQRVIDSQQALGDESEMRQLLSNVAEVEQTATALAATQVDRSSMSLSVIEEEKVEAKLRELEKAAEEGTE